MISGCGNGFGLSTLGGRERCLDHRIRVDDVAPGCLVFEFQHLPTIRMNGSAAMRGMFRIATPSLMAFPKARKDIGEKLAARIAP